MATRARRSPGALKDLGDWKTHYREIWKRPMTTPATQPADRMPLASFLAARQTLRDALATFERVKPDCRTCTHYDMGRCKQFDQDIPKEFQEMPEACESWEYDGIPF
jgi:hypothetical protein